MKTRVERHATAMDVAVENLLLPELASVEERIVETADTISLRLSRPDGRLLVARPGQFNMLGLPGFKEAPFSFSVLDPEGTFVHTIRMAGNVVSALYRLHAGDTVAFRGPFGTGWPLERAEGRNLILVAGGIGMAPLRPVVEYVRQNRDRFRDVYLLYGARTPDDLLYARQLAHWRAEGLNVLLAADQVRKELLLPVQEGVVTKLFPHVRVDLAETLSFLCGPQVMIKFAAGGLLLDGQSARDIYVSLERRMECGVAQCGHCQIGAKFVCKDGPVFALADIKRFQDTLL